MNRVSKIQFSTNLIWKVAEQFTSVSVSLILAMILSRLLEPADFGLIALMMIFTSFSDIFVQAGFNTALVQKKECDSLDFSTVMLLSIVVAMALYAGIFFCAPYLASYYNAEGLAVVLRVFSIIILLNGLNAVLGAAAIREMKFRLMFKANLIGTVFSGSISILLALMGYGIWALIIQKIFQQCIILIIMSIGLKWKYSLVFSIERAKGLFTFASKVLGGAFIAFLSDNTYSAIIGKVYSTDDLGYVNRADTLPSALILNAVTALMGVLLPTLSSYQDDLKEMKSVVRKVIRTATYVIFPMIFGLAAIAKGVIIIGFSEKWLPSVPILQALCIWYLTIPILQILGQVMYALGQSGIRFKLEFIKMCVTVVVVFFLAMIVKVEMYVLILAKGIISIMVIVLNSIYIKRHIGYSLREQLQDMMIPLVFSIIMAGTVWTVSFCNFDAYYTVGIQVILGVSLYLGLSFVFRVQSFYEILGIVKKLAVKGE